MSLFSKCARKFINPTFYNVIKSYSGLVTKPTSHVPITTQISVFNNEIINNKNNWKTDNNNKKLLIFDYLAPKIIKEPVIAPKIYRFPIQHNIININDIHDRNDIIETPKTDKNAPMQAGKSDLIWRRRRMRRHRLLKWRNNFKNLVDRRLRKKLARREAMKEADLRNSWEKFGLTKEPPKLSEEEKKSLVEEWRKEGIWTDALTEEEKLIFHRAATIMKHTDKKL